MCKRTSRAVVLALFLALIARPGGAQPGGHATGTPPTASASVSAPAIIALVEGRPIPAKLYRMYVTNGIKGLGLDESTKEGRRQIQLLKNGVVSELVDRTLLEIEAGRRGLAIPVEMLETRSRKWVLQLGGELAYEAYLAEHGLTDDEFRQIMIQELYGEQLQTELTTTVTVKEAEVREFYAREKWNAAFAALFVEPERVTAAHILIAARPTLVARALRETQGLAGDQLAAAVRHEMARRRQRAEALRHEALAGADFAALARRWSEDPASRKDGGSLGTFTLNTHTTKFDQAAFALGPGQISRVIETEYGFHVIRVAAHIPKRTRTLSDASPLIRERLLARKRSERLNLWLAARRRAADIKIDPYYQCHSSAGPEPCAIGDAGATADANVRRQR